MNQDGNVSSQLSESVGAPKGGIARGLDEIKNKGREMKDEAESRADEAIHRTAESVKRLADQIENSAPSEGRLHDAAQGVADHLRNSGETLADKTVAAFREDLSKLVRKHPLVSVFLSMGVGILVGLTLGGPGHNPTTPKRDSI